MDIHVDLQRANCENVERCSDRRLCRMHTAYLVRSCEDFLKRAPSQSCFCKYFVSVVLVQYGKICSSESICGAVKRRNIFAKAQFACKSNELGFARSGCA
jgi:hypothetical protein